MTAKEFVQKFYKSDALIDSSVMRSFFMMKLNRME
jgi:hypothetical protein